MSYTQDLADYVAALRYEALPDSATQAAKRLTLDLLGDIIPATKYGPGKIINDYVRQLGGASQATVIGTDIRTSTVNAALANGTMAADMELDDVHLFGPHSGSVYVPALLAVAERVDCSGKEWITALVAAYDAGIRVSAALDGASMTQSNQARIYSKGFHPTSVSGVFGAAAGCASLLGLDGDAINKAFGLAACQASGLLAWESEQEHYTKSFQSGMAARNGVAAAELVADGYVGPLDLLDGHYNVFDVFSTEQHFDWLTVDLGSVYEIERTEYKFYTSCRATHPALNLVLELADEHGIKADDVDEVIVRVGAKFQSVMIDNNALTTHNLQFLIAAALVDGEITRVQTSHDRSIDPILQELSKRVTMLHDENLRRKYRPSAAPANVQIRLKDGTTVGGEQPGAPGSVTRPASDADIESKFLRLAAQVFSEERATAIVRSVVGLEAVESIGQLASLLAAE